VLFLSKLVGRNTRPLLLSITTQITEGRCLLGLNWKANDQSQAVVQDARNILAKDLTCVQELVYSIGGELLLSEGRPEILLRLPAPHSMNKVELLH
jgi:hypothetical protein